MTSREGLPGAGSNREQTPAERRKTGARVTAFLGHINNEELYPNVGPTLPLGIDFRSNKPLTPQTFWELSKAEWGEWPEDELRKRMGVLAREWYGPSGTHPDQQLLEGILHLLSEQESAEEGAPVVEEPPVPGRTEVKEKIPDPLADTRFAGMAETEIDEALQHQRPLLDGFPIEPGNPQYRTAIKEDPLIGK